MLRPTISHLMLGVVGLALVMAAFRVHISLGSLVFGLISVSIVRVHRRMNAESVAGRTWGRFGWIGAFVAALGFAAVRLGALFATTILLYLLIGPGIFLLIQDQRFGRHGPSYSEGDVLAYAIVGPLVTWGLLRLLKGVFRNRVIAPPPRVVSDAVVLERRTTIESEGDQCPG